MPYSELCTEELATFQVSLAQGLSIRKVAALLERSPATISREIRRNGSSDGRYRASHAQQHRHDRRDGYRPRRKRLPDSPQFALIQYMLGRRLYPEQISGKLKHMNIPDLRNAYVCRETIYSAIYALPVGALRKELIHCLRQGKPTRKPRRGQVDRRNKIPDMVSIHLRAPEVEKREFPGHRCAGPWEGDLIKGNSNASAVGTLVELKSGYLILAKMNDATATSAVEGFSAALNRMSVAARKSMTYDQGREMTQLSGSPKIPVLLSISVIHMTRGREVPTKTLMGSYGSTCPGERIYQSTASKNWMRSHLNSTCARASASTSSVPLK